MRVLIEDLMQELVKGDRFANVMAESLVRQIAVKMYRTQSMDEMEIVMLQDEVQSIHSFSKAFKKIAGMTPREYQHAYQR